MARADLLINLVRAGSHGDQTLFKKTLEAMIAEERAKQHHVLANNLEELLHKNGSGQNQNSVFLNNSANNFLYETLPQKSLQDLILPDSVLSACQEIIEEHHRSDLLRSYNLEPRNRILLVGPPGNGKTSLAEALAHELVVPLLTIRYEGVIGTYLGETAVRLKKAFEYASTRKCVLFFDEFDTLGKERGDTHETGEIKRVVSSLLLQIDAMPSHVVVVTATNHSELLDRAVWRRFQAKLLLPYPTRAQLTAWFELFEKRMKQPLGLAPRTCADKLSGASYAEAEDFGLMALRRYILSLPNSNMKEIMNQCLKQWQAQVKASDTQEN